MPLGFSGADSSMNRRRRWLAQLPEDTPPAPIRRSRSDASPRADESPATEPEAPPAVVSSLIPERTWKIWTLVACGWLVCITAIAGGAWLDHKALSPWREILGLQAGRLLHFFTTIALLVCTQMSYLILWRRSQSRKDFAGRYQAWFWVGAVCSVLCVAEGTQFHQRWAARIASPLSIGWVDGPTVCWMMPATIMLISAMHLMRRDMRHCVLSTHLVAVARSLAMAAGTVILLGPVVLPAEWLAPARSVLGAVWSAMFATALLWHARFVTHVTNEAAPRDRTPYVRPWWQTRIRTFVRQLSALLRMEWHDYQQRRQALKAAALTASAEAASPTPRPVRERSSKERTGKERPSASVISERTTAPLRSLAQSQPSLEADEEDQPTPSTRAVNMRPLTRSSGSQPTVAHSHEPIPAPHFAINATADRDDEELTSESSEENSTEHSAGQSEESFQNLSKKERKRLQRNQR